MAPNPIPLALGDFLTSTFLRALQSIKLRSCLSLIEKELQSLTPSASSTVYCKSYPLMYLLSSSTLVSSGVRKQLRESAVCSQQSAELAVTINTIKRSAFMQIIDYQSTNIQSIQSIELAIMEKSRFTQTESQVIRQARELKTKLLEMKRKKEQQNTQLVKSELSELYNAKFEQFKKNLSEYFEDQLTAIQLAKELRMTEIVDVQNQVKTFMERIDKQQNILKERQEDLDVHYQDALAFLQSQQSQQLKTKKEMLERELAQRVQNYRETIDIE